ncbi:MAG TPA: hypothetical protein VK696_02900 [Steroidobacteraceae bacterium]|jgi:hypothetical protein|nr:hypothetical protein [Steroidobacteraceae bacterium]
MMDDAKTEQNSALVPRHDTVVILCPEAVTGGPEALHQLAHAINSLGGNARLAYFGQGSTLEHGPTAIVGRHSPNPAVAATYAAYHPVPLVEAPLSEGTLIVAPEILPEALLAIPARNRAVWWLSVDNAISYNPKLNDPGYANTLIGGSGLIHFYQSDYARRFIERYGGSRSAFPLFDYINPEYLRSAPSQPQSRRQQIGLFPQKGAMLASRFMSANPHLSFAAIQNMTREQVRQSLLNCSVYIDFGHHPGKDRVPREAAVSGAIVFLHERGAAASFQDHPLDRFYLFNEEDIDTGSLASRVAEAISDPERHRALQQVYRQRILFGCEEFMLQVRTFFFHQTL